MLAVEQQRTSLREKKREEKALLSGYSNPTSRLFHLPYKAKARSFPLPPGSFKSSRASPEDPGGAEDARLRAMGKEALVGALRRRLGLSREV